MRAGIPEAALPAKEADQTIPRPADADRPADVRIGLHPASRKPTYEELRALVAQYEPPGGVKRKRRPFTRIALIAAIFVVGSAGGFGIASLLADGGNGVPAFTLGSRTLPVRDKGISSSELPYDGRIAEAPPARIPDAHDGMNPGELPFGGIAASSGSSDPAPSPDPTPKEVPVAQEPVPKPVQPAQVEKSVRPAPVQTEAKAKTASPPRHKALARRSRQDSEIDRIRQQAAEELKKKVDAGHSSVSRARNTVGHADKKLARKEGRSQAARRPAMTAMLEQCEQAGNFLLREQCKWQLCGGRWGKDGCPSYPSRTTLN